MIGQRVRLAREACLLTQAELAERAGVPLGSLGDLESGRTFAPSDDVVARIAQATGYPTTFFFRGPLPDMPEGNLRSLKRGKAKVTKQVRAQAHHMVETMQNAVEATTFPPLTIEPFANVSEDLDRIEDLAIEARAQLGLDDKTRIGNVTRILERAGIIVVELPIDMVDHDGFSAWPDFGLGGRPIIARGQHRPGDRDRFTTSHEFGHLMLHTCPRNVSPKHAEAEANRFAGAVLIPRRLAMDLLRPPVTLGVLKASKSASGTSMAMGARRAFDLRIIDKHHYVSLMKQLSARGWRRNEPVEVPRESPLLVPRALKAVAGEGSTRARAERAGLPVFAFNAFAG